MTSAGGRVAQIQTGSTAASLTASRSSGTSLAMQALDALGFPVVGDAVPAGENNLRGTGEAVELRDAMFRLHRSLGGPRGFLPDGWQNTSVACDTREWLTRYLSLGAADEGQPNLALKFPLSSLFLPLLPLLLYKAPSLPAVYAFWPLLLLPLLLVLLLLPLPMLPLPMLALPPLDGAAPPAPPGL